jgi:hypothetical protein
MLLIVAVVVPASQTPAEDCSAPVMVTDPLGAANPRLPKPSTTANSIIRLRDVRHIQLSLKAAVLLLQCDNDLNDAGSGIERTKCLADHGPSQ